MLASIPAAQLFESAMLICFGASWPFAIYKTWKARRVEGKSLVFLMLVGAGYLAGIAAKLLRAHAAAASPEPVTILYAVNAALVAIDAALYLRFRKSPSLPDSNQPVLP